MFLKLNLTSHVWHVSHSFIHSFFLPFFLKIGHIGLDKLSVWVLDAAIVVIVPKKGRACCEADCGSHVFSDSTVPAGRQAMISLGWSWSSSFVCSHFSFFLFPVYEFSK